MLYQVSLLSEDILRFNVMKIIFFEAREREQAVISELLAGNDLVFYKEKLTSENVEKAKDAEILSVFVDSEINKDVIDSLSELKLIVTRSTGFDHIDIKYANTKGIQVANVPAYGSRTVAELAFGLILTLSRNIYQGALQIKEKANFGLSGLRGFDLYGKTLGIVGTGRIGKNMVHIAKGFGMKVLGTDLYPDNKFAEEEGLEYVPLNMLLSASDIVSIHTPYNETTHHLINKENIKFIKKGALLINTARGEVVDTSALVESLKSGDIRGVGLDVLEGERRLKAGERELEISSLNLSLINMPNVIVTPHIAFFSEEAEAEIIKNSAENIKSFIEGNPQNIINLK